MHIEDRTPTVKNPAKWFTGDVWLEPIIAPHDADQRMSGGLVRFAPGARTAWHSHARGQYLRVTEGTALCGTRDGAVVEARPGDTIYTPPGEEHWHGAAEDCFMQHLALLEGADDPSETTTWLEHVTDEDYRRR
ncbi:cupin domain-containing protein [Microbacterium sp. ISL-103]|uniref:(R)-mandelonitrile lyase n=1 Tax=Microbacterium sp. ISL-103 TaxID=2819156 RepID=UPI001BEBFDEC|nr:cupin domain-containing protein [Microbacterium sp. ISL-103]MBT2474777.1 cupin domain-containing protein [Microbacterium sp. ISL-103]